MAQNKYQIFLENSFLILVKVVFYLQPILQMVLAPVHKSDEFVGAGFIISKNCFVTRSH